MDEAAWQRTCCRQRESLPPLSFISWDMVLITRTLVVDFTEGTGRMLATPASVVVMRICFGPKGQV